MTFEAAPTGTGRRRALLGFTSGTTGASKATMHFHRDLLAVADGYAKEVLGVTPADIFVGSPPLAFTFGLGGLAIFPLRFGAAAALLETASPPNLIELIQQYRATICFTAPTAYRVMLREMDRGADLSSLRCAVSAGETLPGPVFEEWVEKTGKPILDGIGATELLHIFISNRLDDARPGCTGRPVTGYEAKVVDGGFRELPRGRAGAPHGARANGLPLSRRRPPAGLCRRWLERHGRPVRPGRGKGRFSFVARNDDMIVSSGYNIAGPEVEAALLAHGQGAGMRRRGGSGPRARPANRPGACRAGGGRRGGRGHGPLACKEHVKAAIAPYKYPRSIVFTDALPKTATGKIQRFRLRPPG